MLARGALLCRTAASGFSVPACNRLASTAHIPVSTAINRTLPAWRLGYATSATQQEEDEDEDEIDLEETKNGFILKAKDVRHSPKKLTLLCRLLGGLNLQEAYAQMAMSEKRVAKTRLKQLIASAWYVAREHHNLDPNELVIKEAWVGKEQFLKRMRFHGKGRIGTVHKPRCTVTIKLEREAPHWVGTGNLAYQRHGKFDGLIKNDGSWKSWKKFPRQVEAPEEAEEKATEAPVASSWNPFA